MENEKSLQLRFSDTLSELEEGFQGRTEERVGKESGKGGCEKIAGP